MPPTAVRPDVVATGRLRLARRRRGLADPVASGDSPLLRYVFVLAYIVFILNLGAVVKFPGYNVLEKGLFLAASAACLLTRPVSRVVVLLMAATVLMIFTLGALSDYPGFSWKTVIFALNQVTIIYALLAFHPTRKDCDAIIGIAALIPIISVTLGLAYTALGLRGMFHTEYASGLPRLQGSTITAYLSGLAMCGAFASMQLAMAGRRTIYYLALFLNLVILLLAGGRAALAVTALTCGISFYASPAIPGRFKVFGSLGAAALVPLLLAGFGYIIFGRFEASGDNGRDMLWEATYKLALDHPWTGIGFGHQFESIPREIVVLAGSAAAHSDYYRLLAELGFVGMPLFYLFLTLAVLRRWMSAEVGFNFTVIGAFVGYLLLSATDNVMSGPAFFPLIILAILTSIRFPQAPKDDAATARARPVQGASVRRVRRSAWRAAVRRPSV